MSQWPYDKLFAHAPEGVVQQQHITYIVLRGKITKETITRKYYPDGDYQDGVTSEVLA